MTDIKFIDAPEVELVKHAASDADVIWAARVSTKGNQSLADLEADPAKSAGLINYLMRDRHGCYDSSTEVLTDAGWLAWPKVKGTEKFATLSADGLIEYQNAERLVRRAVFDEPMLRIKNKTSVDALVTLDHRMFSARRRKGNEFTFALNPAYHVLQAGHKFMMTGGAWHGEVDYNAHRAALLGFIIGDGSAKPGSMSRPGFHLRREDKIEWLYKTADLAGLLVTVKRDEHFKLVADDYLTSLAARTYTGDKFRCVPREVLNTWSTDALRALLVGYIRADGSGDLSKKCSASTVSRQLVDDLQELCLKIGIAMTWKPYGRGGYPGSKQRYAMSFYTRPRNVQPKIGGSASVRTGECCVENYTGDIHCVTVPNGTLYVRRNGKPMWSGNSPFEHSSLTFFVRGPIFMWREHFRHRIASYNEESGRYKVLEPVFYVPGPDRNLVQQGKPGHYEFIPGTADQVDAVRVRLMANARYAYADYEALLRLGVAKEVARMGLPLNICSSAYVTMNARALMNFLSLRRHSEQARFPSFPQREIEMVAERYELEWSRLMPLTHAAFVANGRVAP